MALGNVIGSNIFNILMVLGIASAVRPGGFPDGERHRYRDPHHFQCDRMGSGLDEERAEPEGRYPDADSLRRLCGLYLHPIGETYGKYHRDYQILKLRSWCLYPAYGESAFEPGTSRKKEYLLPRARRLLSGLWLQAAVRQPFWRKKEESGEKPGRSWSGSRSFRFSQRSLRFSPK